MASNIVFGFCQQRTKLQLFNQPIIRLELQKSPYDKYTKTQLDMRRKAEILKYAPMQQTNQTNNVTKKQKWTQLVNGSIQQPTQQVLHDISNGHICPNDRLIPTPTSSCDIPGPVIYLIDDETIPLYNYATNVDAYAVDNATIFTPYAVSYNSNIICSPEVDTKLASILINQGNNSITSIFSFTIPLAIYISGQITTDASAPPFTNPITVSISNIIANVYFNNTIINSSDATQNPYIYSTQPIITTNIYPVIFDVSGQGAFTPPTTNSVGGLRPPEEFGRSGNFSAVQYIGTMTVSNIPLNNNNKAVYDLDVNFKTYITAYDGKSITSLSTGVYMNITSAYINSVTNCNIRSSPYTNPYVPIHYSGISS
jgi:hypothetical protein